MAREKTKTKRKVSKNIAAGVAHVNSSFNNTKILISDVQGNAISWSLKGRVNRHLTRLRWLLKMQVKKPRTTA